MCMKIINKQCIKRGARVYSNCYSKDCIKMELPVVPVRSLVTLGQGLDLDAWEDRSSGDVDAVEWDIRLFNKNAKMGM